MRFLKTRWVLPMLMWGLLATAALALASILVGGSWSPKVIALQAAMPLAAVAGVGGAVLAASRRKIVPVAVSVVVVGACVWQVAPTLRPTPLAAWTTDAPQLTVYSANVYRKNERPEQAFRAAAQSDADVVVLTEYMSSFDDELEESGLTTTHPTIVRDGPEDSTIVLTRLPSIGTRVLRVDGFTMPEVTVRIDGTVVTVVGVHTQAPHQYAFVDKWKRDLGAVREVTSRLDTAIAVGDFNSAWWNQPFQDLIESGLVDAHVERGEGYVRTWGVRGVGPIGSLPLLGIDHALSRGAVTPVSAGDGTIPGSDHRSVTVRYAVRTSSTASTGIGP